MTDIASQTGDGVPTYLGSGDPALSDYYPAWVGNLADDVTIEGSLLLLSRLVGEKLAGTPNAKYFLAAEA